MLARRSLNRLVTKLERPYDVYNRIEVSASALHHNLKFFRDTTGLQVIPVLKGNAYGHGIEQVATALKKEAIPYIAVDGYFEALKVRQFTDIPVLIMGMIKPHNFKKLRLYNFTFVVQDVATIHALGALRKKIQIHLELNTGMNRYGIDIKQLDAHIAAIKQYPKLQLEGVMAHLADPDGTEPANISHAVQLYDEAVDHILATGLTPTIFHTAQSGGSLRAQSRHANTMRLGIGLYGINPYPPTHPLHATLNIHPALRLISTISKIQQLEKGNKVSYNYTFTAPKAMTIGILPLGYHEGVNRALSNKGVIKIGSHFQPIIGRVCMNHTIVSLDGADAKVGDEVVVYSNITKEPNSIDAIAKTHGLFSYSLLTDLSPDTRRILVG